MRRRDMLAGGIGAAPLPWGGGARAQKAARPSVTIGLLSDLAGPYAGIAGQGSVACARLAVSDFVAAARPDFDVKVISADHRNDPARGVSIASDWLDHQGVDLILDVPNSAVALAVAAVTRARNAAYINCGAGATELTGRLCAPATIHWSYDTDMLARSTGGAFTQAGGSSWFFIAADYAFGRQLETVTTHYVIAAGGRIEGRAAYPFPGTTDFEPVLRQAQQSGAAVLGLANAGQDVIACVRGAHELGLAEQMRIACLLMQLPDVHALGLDLAGGLMLTESFYWNLNERSRAFTARLMAQEKPPTYPDMTHAGCYAGTLHFLKAMAASGAAGRKRDGASVVARMKAMPTDDDAFGTGRIRADGMAMFPALLFRVKTQAESAGPWDYYQLISSTPPDEAYRRNADDGCAAG